jgi:methylmalonyl-CoA mutase
LAHPDVIILETSGIGQSGSEVSDFADVSMYVMTPEYGASTQLEKIDMLDYADLVALNKSDKRGALDALQAVRKQFQRNHLLWEQPLDEMPVYATKASQFNDHGTTELYNRLVSKVNDKFADLNLKTFVEQEITDEVTIIPPKEFVIFLKSLKTTDNTMRMLKNRLNLQEKCIILKALKISFPMKL